MRTRVAVLLAEHRDRAEPARPPPWSVTNQRTSRSRSSTSLISSSTSPSTLCGTAPGVVKSNRSRPGRVQRARPAPPSRRARGAGPRAAGGWRSATAETARPALACRPGPAPGRRGAPRRTARSRGARSAPAGALHVGDRELAVAAARVDRRPAPVATAGRRPRRRTASVEHDLDLVALARRRQQPRRADQRGDGRLARDLGVAGELGRPARSSAAAVDARGPGAGLLARGASALPARAARPSAGGSRASSTSMPCSAAISRVRSIGKP